MERKKVLLVDDSRTSLFMEQMILKQEPLEIVTARDGVEAVEKAEAERPDLILMDVVMPRMDGLAALRALRGRDTTRHIPVIMVTTRGEGESVEDAFASGCSDYVTKPIDPLELVTKVRSLMGEEPAA